MNEEKVTTTEQVEPINNSTEKSAEQATPKEKPQINKTEKGVVFGCSLLNIRETPTIDGTVKGFIAKGTKVTIDQSQSTYEFYGITTKDGITGFCMQEFIKVY